VLRFITGLGLGGVVPTMATFAAELSPQKSRNFAVTAVSSGYSLGAALTGVAALWMVPHWGWPSLFLLGGGLTVVTLPLVLKFLPSPWSFCSASSRRARSSGSTRLCARCDNPRSPRCP
jgi:AAHS family 4-hydroxybenzoate transporter-like MFS transporter